MTENSIPKITCILPVQQVQAPQFQVHISYFLQNCKKGKSPKKDLPSLKKRYYNFWTGYWDCRYIAMQFSP